MSLKIKPKIFSENQYKKSDIVKLKSLPNVTIVDVYKQQSKELFEIQNPDKIKLTNFGSTIKKFIKTRIDRFPDTYGDWIYFPWNNHLVHSVNKSEYTALRTNRNRDIISEKEQKKLLDTCIAFAGLSVGSSIATTAAYQGIAETIKLSEFDTLDTTNLNRLRAGVHQIGKPKIDIISQQIYEINPYQRIIPFGRIDENSLEKILNENPKPTIILDEIDSIAMKVQLRFSARKARVPIVMLTNLGENSLLDIERYDLDDSIKPFNGLVDQKILDEILENRNPSTEAIQRYAIAIIGKENIPKKVLKYVMQVGKTLVGRPQIMSTVTLSAAIAVQTIRNIILKKQVPSGRNIFTYNIKKP